MRCRVAQGGGAGNRLFAHSGACKKIIEQIRHKQCLLGDIKNFGRISFYCHKLIQSVELHKLKTAVRILLFFRHNGKAFFYHAVGSAVAVMNWIA